MASLTAHISPCAVEINSRVCANYGPRTLSPNLGPLGPPELWDSALLVLMALAVSLCVVPRTLEAHMVDSLGST